MTDKLTERRLNAALAEEEARKRNMKQAVNSPLLPDEDDPDFSTSNFSSGPSKQMARSYKCPRCGGEFNSWERRISNGPSKTEHCPFCNLEKGEYEPAEE